MPHFKFDDDSLEPREVIRPDLTPYVALLKTKRTRSRRKPKSWPAPGPRASTAPSPRASPEPPSRWTRLDTPPAPISYPASVVPSPSNKRKEKGGYCMRFSRSLDRFHECPNVYDEAQCEPLPPLLRLPAELRVSCPAAGCFLSTCSGTDQRRSNTYSTSSSTTTTSSCQGPTPRLGTSHYAARHLKQTCERSASCGSSAKNSFVRSQFHSSERTWMPLWQTFMHHFALLR